MHKGPLKTTDKMTKGPLKTTDKMHKGPLKTTKFIPRIRNTNRVPVEGKSSVCVISMKYRNMI